MVGEGESPQRMNAAALESAEHAGRPRERRGEADAERAEPLPPQELSGQETGAVAPHGGVEPDRHGGVAGRQQRPDGRTKIPPRRRRAASAPGLVQLERKEGNARGPGPDLRHAVEDQDARVLCGEIDRRLALGRDEHANARLGGQAPRAHQRLDVPGIDYVALARSLGADAHRVERFADLAPALDQAWRANGPVVVSIAMDPTIRPLLS